MQEGKSLEFKSHFSKTFLKTVSAFANYGTGEIVFGVDDEGHVVGLENPEDLALRIENSINDSLEPMPVYSITIDQLDGRDTVRLKVEKGLDTPYYASGKAYRRSDSATVAVDKAQLKRLVMEGLSLSFEECPAPNQNLTFKALDSLLRKRLDIEDVDEKVYRTLEMYTTDYGFNNAAAVLADENPFPGIDIVRFGSSINEFMERQTLEHVSALTLYEQAAVMFDRYYKFELVDGLARKEEHLVPEHAYREAIANALVHRTWDIAGAVKVSLFDDRVEVSSPGGLPQGVSKSDYLAGRLSVLRNPIIAGVFARLGYIERFGTGIPRIRAAYEGKPVKPRFEITDSSITVILPVVTTPLDLGAAEKAVLELLEKKGPLARSQIEKSIGKGKSTVTRILKRLEDKRLIEVEGSGRATKYLI